MMIEVTCSRCGKAFRFDPTGTPSATAKQMVDGPRAENRTYFPRCTHCDAPNFVHAGPDPAGPVEGA